MSASNKIHFPGLDGLRFISISFVVIHHLLTFKNYFGLEGFDVPVIGLIGYYGIQFFFAGSGFLITYLLLVEIGRNGMISLKYFYLRRILRIWPAYYILIILALIICLQLPFFRIPGLTDEYLSSNHSHTGNLFYFLFLPHLAPLFFPTAPYVHQTYTIGIEEQFYFIWGLLFLILARYAKNIFIFLLIVIPLLNLYQFYFLSIEGFDGMPVFKKFISGSIFYIKYCRFSTFAIGSLLAYAFFQKKKWINVFRSVPIQLFIYALLIVSISFDLYIPYLRDEYISALMLAIFCCATFKDDSLVKYDAKWISFLGKISYGIYLFHIFAIVFTIKIFVNVFNFKLASYFGLIILSLASLILSIIFGWLSYYSVERFFLKIKRRLTRI